MYHIRSLTNRVTNISYRVHNLRVSEIFVLMVVRVVIRHNRQMFNTDGSKDRAMVASAVGF